MLFFLNRLRQCRYIKIEGNHVVRMANKNQNRMEEKKKFQKDCMEE